MKSYRPEHYLKFKELEALLKEAQNEFADLVDLESIGKTLQGRDIWLVTLTNKKTGKHDEKPAYWVDGNTHAVELAGCQAAIHLLYKCLTEYRKDPQITRLLNEQTLYVVPRISADGAEMALTTPFIVRSTPLNYPYAESLPGLYAKDLDNNGLIAMMRVKDPAGPWRISKKDSRIMVLREPDEWSENEDYFHIYPEGEIQDFDGHKILPRTKHGLDMNRQYPNQWLPEGKQAGAGPHALSQPESRAVFDAISKRPNIVGAQSFHTFSSVILRPFLNQPDDKMNLEDLEAFKKFGKRGEEITNYPCLSVYQDFRYSRDADFGGGWIDWAYRDRGIFAFTNEIWHIAKAAGIEIEDHVRWFFDSGAEDETLKILQWCEKNLDAGSFFEDWKKFQHPQLGEVEIGGWKPHYTWNNPPHKFLPKEVESNANFVLSCAYSNPRVKIKEAKTEKLEGELKKISIKIHNDGYLPTYGSQHSLAAGITKAPRLRLELDENLELISGESDFETQHLAGRASLNWYKNLVIYHLTQSGPANHYESNFEWVVKGKGSAKIEIEFEKAGKLRHCWEIA